MKPRLDILHSEPQSAKCPVGNDLSVSWLLHVQVVRQTEREWPRELYYNLVNSVAEA